MEENKEYLPRFVFEIVLARGILLQDINYFFQQQQRLPSNVCTVNLPCSLDIGVRVLRG